MIFVNNIEKKRYDIGIEYLTSSSNKNFIKAINDLAEIYYYEKYNCKKDLEKIIFLYERVVFLGDRQALYTLLYIKVEQVGKIKTFIYFLKNL